VESAPRAYRLKASNAAPLISTLAGAIPFVAPETHFCELVSLHYAKWRINLSHDVYDIIDLG
jgi:hypothetical protein